MGILSLLEGEQDLVFKLKEYFLFDSSFENSGYERHVESPVVYYHNPIPSTKSYGKFGVVLERRINARDVLDAVGDQ